MGAIADEQTRAETVCFLLSGDLGPGAGNKLIGERVCVQRLIKVNVHSAAIIEVITNDGADEVGAASTALKTEVRTGKIIVASSRNIAF